MRIMDYLIAYHELFLLESNGGGFNLNFEALNDL